MTFVTLKNISFFEKSLIDCWMFCLIIVQNKIITLQIKQFFSKFGCRNLTSTDSEFLEYLFVTVCVPCTDSSFHLSLLLVMTPERCSFSASRSMAVREKSICPSSLFPWRTLLCLCTDSTVTEPLPVRLKQRERCKEKRGTAFSTLDVLMYSGKFHIALIE